MAKVALLIGVSEYESGLNPLPAAVKDIQELQRVLKDPDMGGFDEVKTLANPNRQTMESEIETLFSGRNKDDLVLLFFSGHGIKDDGGKLYFATRITSKNSKGELIRSTAVPANFVHEIMNNSRAKRQAIILDCCFSGAFDPALQAKDDGSVDLETQLGAEGRVVLTSSSSTQYSYEQQGSDLSIYTRYLVEGIETGAGDLDKDGQVSILELHEYVTSKVQEEIKNVTPKIIVLKDKGFEMILAKTKITTNQILNTNNRKIDLGEIKLEASQGKGVVSYYNSIPSLLQPLNPFLDRLIEQIKNKYISQRSSNNLLDKNSQTNNFILDSIRYASDADLVIILNYSKSEKTCKVKSQSNLSIEINESNYAEIIRQNILSNISLDTIFDIGHHGIYRTYYEEAEAASKNFLLIPLDSLDNIEFMVVCGLAKDSYFLNDAYTKIVSSFYKASQ